MLRNLSLLAWTQGQILEAHVRFATRSAVFVPLWETTLNYSQIFTAQPVFLLSLITDQDEQFSNNFFSISLNKIQTILFAVLLLLIKRKKLSSSWEIELLTRYLLSFENPRINRYLQMAKNQWQKLGQNLCFKMASSK